MKNLLLTICFSSLSILLLGQQFLPPESFNFPMTGDSANLIWSPPSNASPTHYNIYYSTFLHLDIGIKIGTTSLTQATFSWPDFAYKQCWGISASYENPAGESDIIYECMSLPGIVEYPYLFDFESPGENRGYLAAVRNIGSDTWEVRDNTYLSPSHSANYISDSIGYRASLWTLMGVFNQEISRNLSFWYKTPSNQGFSDTIKFHYEVSQNATPKIITLDSANEWQFFEISLSEAPLVLEICFEATAAGGNGVYLDDIRFFEEIVDVKEQKLTVASVDIFPNPASSYFSLILNLPEPADVKLTLCSMEGKVIKTNASQPMLPGKQSMTMDVSDLISGIYLVSVEVNDKIINQKVVKL